MKQWSSGTNSGPNCFKISSLNWVGFEIKPLMFRSTKVWPSLFLSGLITLTFKLTGLLAGVHWQPVWAAMGQHLPVEPWPRLIQPYIYSSWIECDWLRCARITYQQGRYRDRLRFLLRCRANLKSYITRRIERLDYWLPDCHADS